MIAPPTPVPTVTKTISATRWDHERAVEPSKTFQVHFGEMSRNIQKPKKFI
jgi:hypothetical protein